MFSCWFESESKRESEKFLPSGNNVFYWPQIVYIKEDCVPLKNGHFLLPKEK